MYADLSGVSIDVCLPWGLVEAPLLIRRDRSPTLTLRRLLDILDLTHQFFAFLSILCMGGSGVQYSALAITSEWSPPEAGQRRSIIPMDDVEAACWALSFSLFVIIQSQRTKAERTDVL